MKFMELVFQTNYSFGGKLFFLGNFFSTFYQHELRHSVGILQFSNVIRLHFEMVHLLQLSFRFKMVHQLQYSLHLETVHLSQLNLQFKMVHLLQFNLRFT